MLESMSFEKQSWNNPERPEGPRDKVNILLVDDRPENLTALEATLGDLDQNLFKAASGHEALKLLLDHEFALILLDVEMPHMDGFELARMIRGRNQSRHTPIIFLTAINKSESQVFEGYSLGAVDYLLKPFAPDLLRSKALAFVDLFRKRQQVKRQAELLRQNNTELDEMNRRVVVLCKELEARNAELQAERNFIATVLDCAPGLVVVRDRKGRIVRCNRVCEEITGYSSQEANGSFLWDLFLPTQEAERARADFERVLKGATTLEREYIWVTKYGAQRLIAWANTPVCGPTGSVDYVVSTGMDITERKRAEEARLQFAREQIARAEAEVSARRTAFLAEAGTILGSSLDYPTILKNIVRLGVPGIADLCVVCAVEPDGSAYKIEVAAQARDELAKSLENQQPDLSNGNNPLVQVLHTGVPILLSEVSRSELTLMAQNSEHLSLLEQLGIRSVMVVPLESHGRILGAISFLSSSPERHYTKSDLFLAEDLARRAALAVENAFLYRSSGSQPRQR